MILQGIVIQLLPTEVGTRKNGGQWNKQGYIIEYGDDKYPKQVAVYLWGDLATNNPFTLGAEVELDVDLESREYNGRWYTEVKCWRVLSGQSVGGGQTAVASGQAAAPTTAHRPLPTDNDLPF